MKITAVHELIRSGEFPQRSDWRDGYDKLLNAIRQMAYPTTDKWAGNQQFLIYPEKGKESQKGNGVKPIKFGLMDRLVKMGWETEAKIDIASRRQPGSIDAVWRTNAGPVALEWETGNVSSSHRSINKMALGLLKGKIKAGLIIVPSRPMYNFLTDRIGNEQELEPYFELWESVQCRDGLLQIIVVEHDATSTEVPRIPKGTDGRARI